MDIKVRIPAKVNLSLSVTGRSGRLHTLSSEVLSVNLYDEITAEEGGAGVVFSVHSSLANFSAKRFLPLLEHAKALFVDRYGAVNATVTVTKNIPLGAGLGGSSAAVVGVVIALAKIKKVQLDCGFLLSLGSDIPYMFAGGHCIISGTGGEVEKLKPLKKHFVALVPCEGVDSAQAYVLYDAIGAMPFGKRTNDLELAARKLNPQIVHARKVLEDAGAEDVIMSGSGSAVLAVFDDGKSASELFLHLNYDGLKYLLFSV